MTEKYPIINVPNDLLYLTPDPQNHFDPSALLLKTEDHHLVGYLPRYLAKDVYELLKKDPKKLNVQVERVNPVPTPIQLRLLCNLTAEWPKSFHPFSSQNYLPIIDKVAI